MVLFSLLSSTTVNQAKGETLLYSKDFRVGDDSGWVRKIGSWGIVEGEYTATGASGTPMSLVPVGPLTDFTFEGDLRITQGGAAHIALRLQSLSYSGVSYVGDGVLLVIFPGGGSVYWHVIKSGEGLAQNFQALGVSVDANSTVKVTVKVQGNSYQAYINDVLVNTLEDDTYSSGYVGLCVNLNYATPTRWNNVKISGSLAAGGAVSSPGSIAPPRGLICWWPGDGDVNDLVGSNKGVPHNGTGYGSGLVGEAFSFDYIIDSVDMYGNVTNDLQALTIELWVKLDTLPSRIMRFVTLNGEKACLRYDGYNDPMGRQLHFYMFFESGVEGHIRVNDVLLTGVWQHIAATYDGTVMRLYLNGIEIQRLTIVEKPVKGNGVTLSSDFHEYFEGSLDEVSIYNRALGQEEIKSIYVTGQYGKIKPTVVRYAPQPVDVTLTVTTGIIVSVGLPFLFGLAGVSERIREQLSKAPMPKWLSKFIKMYSEKAYGKIVQKEAAQILEVGVWRQVVSIALSCLILFTVYVYVEVNGVPNFLKVDSILFSAPQVLASVVAVFLFTQVFSIVSVRSLRIWSQFKLWLWGIAALLVTGFVFKVPFSSPTRMELQRGLDVKSSGLLAVSRALCLYMTAIPFYLFDLMGNVVAGDAGRMMVMMGAFYSSLPLKPMDGEVVFRYDGRVWFAFFLVSLALFIGVLFDVLPHYVYLMVGVASLVLYLGFIRYINGKKAELK